MGYLSCRAESSVLTSADPITTTITNTHKTKPKETPEKPIKIQEFHYRDLQAATNNFSDQKLLGKGSHGSVYKAVLRSGRLVAVKKPSRRSTSSSSTAAARLTPSSSGENPNEVENEIDILSKIHSPRLVNLVGFSTDSKDRLLVVEFMSNGTLYDVLHANSRSPANWGRRIRLALQTAKAIDTLHSLDPPVIHRDIKSANVLIDRNFNARLGDFGLALRCHNDFRLRSTPPAGTIGYLDPGYVTPDNLSTRTDVFSFGILLLEIISGRKAIDVSHSPPSIVDWAIPLIRKGKLLSIYDPRIAPPKDPYVRKQLAVIAAKCVRSCRERRPSMKEVVECLSGLSKMVPINAWNGFSVNNPCLMVDAVGRPVESGAGLSLKQRTFRDHERGKCGTGNVSAGDVPLAMRNSRRVYSDLGIGGRNNLMDLLAETDGESNFLEEDRGSEAEIDGRLVVGIGSNVERLAQSCDRDGMFQMMRRNQSVGGNSSRPVRHGRLYVKEFQIK